jgi:FKBP-type peptidyl-prolyl cis-trans isomerase FklB
MKYKSLLLAACLSFATLISCNGQKGKSNVTLKTQADSVAYGIGVSIGQNMKKDGLDSLNLDILTAAMKAAMQGDSTTLNAQQAQGVIQAYLNTKQQAKANAAMETGKKWLEENKKKPGVIELPDGLQYQVMKEGTGAMPKETDTVSVHYHGTLIDGTIFDSSVERGQPAEFPLNGVIKGWTEALQLMKVGSKWKLFLPPSLAYGDRAAGPKIPANSTLIFEVELLSIKGK